MENGWIKLHRKIQKKGYYKNSKYVHLWVHLLLNANHRDKEFMWNENIVIVKEGQLLAGRHQLSVDTGISESSIERILNLLENEHQIEQQKTTKYRLITIVNWRSHQLDGQQNGQQADNKRTTDGQQTDTNKNNKKRKNNKNKEVVYFESLYNQYFLEFVNLLPMDLWKRWIDYRKETKHQLTITTAEAQLKKLLHLNKLGSKPTDVINQSIENGWQGLFEVKNGRTNNGSGATIEGLTSIAERRRLREEATKRT